MPCCAGRPALHGFRHRLLCIVVGDPELLLRPGEEDFEDSFHDLRAFGVEATGAEHGLQRIRPAPEGERRGMRVRLLTELKDRPGQHPGDFPGLWPMWQPLRECHAARMQQQRLNQASTPLLCGDPMNQPVRSSRSESKTGTTST